MIVFSVHMTKKDLPNISTIFNVTASEEDVNSPQESLNTPDPYSAEKRKLFNIY